MKKDRAMNAKRICKIEDIDVELLRHQVRKRMCLSVPYLRLDMHDIDKIEILAARLARPGTASHWLRSVLLHGGWSSGGSTTLLCNSDLFLRLNWNARDIWELWGADLVLWVADLVLAFTDKFLLGLCRGHLDKLVFQLHVDVQVGKIRQSRRIRVFCIIRCESRNLGKSGVSNPYTIFLL